MRGDAGAGNEVFSVSPPNGAGVGAGVGSIFAEGAGKINVAREGAVGIATTGGTGEGNADWVVPSGPEVSIKLFVPVERGVGSDVAGGVD